MFANICHIPGGGLYGLRCAGRAGVPDGGLDVVICTEMQCGRFQLLGDGRSGVRRHACSRDSLRGATPVFVRTNTSYAG